MLKTVRDILDLDSFEGAKAVAGFEGLSRTVTGASLMEVPDVFPYLEHGTLLLTTLFPIANDDSRMRDFVARLNECGVAGVCIKPRRYVEEIPAHILEQADELGLPVLELPPDANLSRMANRVLSLQLNEYIVQLQFRNHVHNALAELLLNDSDVEGLVGRLGELISRYLDGLAADDRTLFIRRYWNGDAVSELAGEIGVRPNSLTKRLLRLREGLRRYLEGEGVRV